MEIGLKNVKKLGRPRSTRWPSCPKLRISGEELNIFIFVITPFL